MSSTFKTRQQFRRGKALRALTTYLQGEDDWDLKDAVTDILTDLRHLCEHREIDFKDALEKSDIHYTIER